MPIEDCLPTPEAIGHLNLELIVSPSGKCLSARTKNKTIINQLIDKGYIEPYHAEEAYIFSTLRDVWLGKLIGHTDVLSDGIRGPAQRMASTELYDGICRLMKPHESRIILWATSAEPILLTALIGDACRQAFESLSEAFEICRKRD